MNNKNYPSEEAAELRRRAEEALRESELKLRAILDATPFPVAIVDLQDNNIYFWSRSALTLFGHTAPTATAWYQIAYPDPDYRLEVIDRWKPFLEIARESGQAINTGEYRVTCSDGSVRICELYAAFLADSLIVTFNDITGRKRAEEALQESEERHRTLLQTAMDGFWMADMQGRLLEVNETYCRMSGYDAQELLTMRISDLEDSQTADDLAAHGQKIMARGQDRFETRHRRKDGSILDVEVSIQYRPSDGGRLVAFLRDITERKQIEVRLQQAQKMESIGTLAGGIAHDFNNILYPLLGFAELLKEDLPADSPLQGHIDEILRATLRSKELVKQILAFSRKGDQNARPLRLHPLVKEALKLLRSSIPTTIDIQQDLDAGCGIVIADPTQVHQIVMNLATNAYHAMEDTGGRLNVGLKEIALTSASDPSVTQILAPGNYALLTVSDTGTGIEKDILDKIFDPYFTTKEIGKGTGLGLSVVHGIVKAHKGDILIESQPGKGTRVHVYLPIMAQPAENKSGEDNEPIRGGTERILLVDDEEVIVRLEKQMLERLGYRVEERSSSYDALKAFSANPSAFDLVITDMTMPNMTGDQLARALISIRQDIPIIICTGFSEKIDPEKAKARGIKGLLMKPVINTVMGRMVRKVLDEVKGLSGDKRNDE